MSPSVGSRKFPYTPAGEKMAKQAAARTGKKLVSHPPKPKPPKPFEANPGLCW